MLTIKVLLPPNVSADVIDFIEVQVLDNTRDRQPRHTSLEGVQKSSLLTTVTFTD